MTLQSMSFIFGALLLAVGILGGGCEVKEIKVSNASIGVRIIAGIAGLFFIGLGFWQQLSAVLESASAPRAHPHQRAQVRGHLRVPQDLRQSQPKPWWRSSYPLPPIASASTWAQSMCQHKIIKRLPSVTVESG